EIAIIAVGYADGYPISIAQHGCVWIEGHQAPIMGRLSMDSTIIDITDLPPAVRMNLQEGDWVSLLLAENGLNALAKLAQLGSPAMLLTGLTASRFKRHYHRA